MQWNLIETTAKLKAIEALPDIDAEQQEPKDITRDALLLKAREILEAMGVEDLRQFVEGHGH